MKNALKQIEKLLDIDPMNGVVIHSGQRRLVVDRITHEPSLPGELMTVIYYSGSSSSKSTGLLNLLNFITHSTPYWETYKLFVGVTRDDLVARLLPHERARLTQQ